MVRTQKPVRVIIEKAVCIACGGERCDVQLKVGVGSSVWNLVLVVLQHVVRFAPVGNTKVWNVSLFFQSLLADYIFLLSSPAAEETALDDFNDEGCCLFLAHLRVEASSNF